MSDQDLQAQLEAIHNSTSWKITAPLRFFSRLFSGELSVKSIAKKIIVSITRLAVKNPILLRVGAKLLVFFPQLRTSLRHNVFFESQVATTKNADTVAPVHYIEKELSPKAKAILFDLRFAIRKFEEHKKIS